MNDFASFLNVIFGSILTICVTVVSTMGISLIFKTSNTTNFAQGSIAAFGCYVTAYLSVEYGVPYWLGIIIGIIIGFTLGLLIDVGIFRRGKSVNPIGKQIITMGIVTLVVGIIPLIFGAENAPQIPPFVEGNFTFILGDITVAITYHSLVCLAITIVVLTAVFLLLYKSKMGLGIRATASSEQTASILGINTHVVTATSWALAAGLAVLAAIMLNAGTSVLSATFMTHVQVNSFLGGILGGFSTFYGPIVGAIIVPLVSNFVGFFGIYADFFLKWNEVIVYAAMLIIILIKPQGLFGKKIVKKV